jgi:ABC-type oligopeptide transport system ATPase subunit
VTLLDVRNLVVEYPGRRSRPPTRAVDDVSFEIGPRETLGLVGESGSGKTTIGRAILGLTPVTGGTIAFAGKDITRARYNERRALSGDLQVVFQDPYSSLNPTRTVGQTLAEPVRGRSASSPAELQAAIAWILDRVGLAADAAKRYPSHFSGGQRQRIAIARALIVRPRLVICDEPVSSLDLSVQAQVLNLFRELQDELSVSYLFVAHDLAVVRHLSDRIVVLHQGRVVEQGSAERVYRAPVEPYTKALLEASPIPDPELQRARRLARGIA